MNSMAFQGAAVSGPKREWERCFTHGLRLTHGMYAINDLASAGSLDGLALSGVRVLLEPHHDHEGLPCTTISYPSPP